MKVRKHTEEQIIAVLKEGEAGAGLPVVLVQLSQNSSLAAKRRLGN